MGGRPPPAEGLLLKGTGPPFVPAPAPAASNPELAPTASIEIPPPFSAAPQPQGGPGSPFMDGSDAPGSCCLCWVGRMEQERFRGVRVRVPHWVSEQNSRRRTRETGVRRFRIKYPTQQPQFPRHSNRFGAGLECVDQSRIFGMMGRGPHHALLTPPVVGCVVGTNWNWGPTVVEVVAGDSLRAPRARKARGAM